VKTPPAGLAQQFLIALRSYEGIGKVQEALKQVRKVRAQVKQLQDRAEKKEGKLTDALTALGRKAAALEGQGGGRGRRGGGAVGPDVGMADVLAAGAFGPGLPQSTPSRYAGVAALTPLTHGTKPAVPLSGHVTSRHSQPNEKTCGVFSSFQELFGPCPRLRVTRIA
jgi:hypothetical protein